MDLALTDDQRAILDAMDGLCRPYDLSPGDCRGFVLASPELDAALAEGGFLDVAFDPDLGPAAAALVTERLARLPYATESAASALVRPLFGEGLQGPTCLVDGAGLRKPVRFLQPGASVVVVGETDVLTFTAEPADVQPVSESLYAYPMGILAAGEGWRARARSHNVSAAEVRARWRVALACEIAGLLEAAIASAVGYVSERKQFGRPLASFQALRHRLAGAHVRALGARWLALKAAGTGEEADAALAAAFAQDCATEVVYDLHQFLGAMGVTLEHPLHLWTYRIKALLGELGGRSVQGAQAAALIWAA